MDRKEIQEERMRGYFIASAEKIIKGEGVKALSVRTVAEEAGYSYATMYNYFSDLRDLLCVCVENFAKECRQYVAENLNGPETGKERIKIATLAYIRFFVQYPGIFHLFFLENMPEIANQKRIAKAVDNITDDMLEADWDIVAGNKALSNTMMKTHAKTVKGLLLMYINRRIPETYKEMLDEYDSIFNFIIE